MDLSFLDTYPIYLISSHGEYQLGERDDEIEPMGFTVPPNVYIFEMSEIGELCLTDADKATWELCQGENRQDFINYFINNTGTEDLKKRIFGNLTFYQPGDYIYTRYLKMGENTRDTRSGPASYGSFGFYKFNVNDPHFTYGDGNGTMPIFSNLMNILQASSDNFTSTRNVIGRVFKEDKPTPFHAFPGGIFFISSCGAHGCEDYQTQLCDNKMTLIAKNQRRQKLYLLSQGITSIAGPSTADEGKSRPLRYTNRVTIANNKTGEWMSKNYGETARSRFAEKRTGLKPSKRMGTSMGRFVHGRTRCQVIMGKLTCGLLGGRKHTRRAKKNRHKRSTKRRV
jgi:hypothetical protein